MANFRTIILGTSESDTEEHELECFLNSSNEIFISISSGDYPPSFICLDKKTAIKLVDILNSEISKTIDL
ncbi:hypothetical protein [Seonamhaeicola sp.]|uniref:hypothetical protein n=1 Tax=Seonamhaeicola sp. TaxID=1912245 RepID=UPI0035686DD5